MEEEIADKFAEACKVAILRQFNDRRSYKVRLSGIGKPLCQQKAEERGTPEDREYNLPMKFLFGDVVEAIGMAVMEAAGVNITGEQEAVSLTREGIEIPGTLDVTIDEGTDEVWDIKSASPFAFDKKFSEWSGFEAMREEDVFGYIPQGYAYAEAKGKPFGGWIAINKVDGRWSVAQTPNDDEEYRVEALETIDTNLKALKTKKKYLRMFPEEPEHYLKTQEGDGPTGNMLMPRTCTFCGFKSGCWPKAEFHEKVASMAKSRPMTWYTKLVNKGEAK